MNDDPENVDLVHSIYTSVSTAPTVPRADLEAILEQSRRKNAANGITGMLLFQDGSFFQILEGDRTAVEAIFEKIAVDKRHTRVTKIIVEPIDERDFGDWTMGYPAITLRELASIDGLNDFFRNNSSFSDIGTSRAKTLLAAFKEKQWRV